MSQDSFSLIQHRMSADLIIYHGNIALELEKDKCELIGVVWQDFKDNRLRFEGTIEKKDKKVINSFYNFLEEKPNYVLSLPNHKPCKVRISNLDLTKENIIFISGNIIDISIQLVKETQVDTVFLDVCNYVEKLNVYEFKVNDWVLKVIKREDEKSEFEKLTNSKETTVTHRFIVRKKIIHFFIQMMNNYYYCLKPLIGYVRLLQPDTLKFQTFMVV